MTQKPKNPQQSKLLQKTEFQSGVSIIVLFDGDCTLCTAGYRILFRKAPSFFFYSTLNSKYAELHQINNRSLTVIKELRESESSRTPKQVLTRSRAVFEIIKYLPFPYRLLLIFNILPTGLADLFYRGIAHNRHFISRIYRKITKKKDGGSQNTCFIPQKLGEEERKRVLE